MTARSLMFIAGEASGDANAAELIKALHTQAPDVQLFGAGGPKMREAGMELLLDLTEHAVVGLVEVLKNYGKFRRIFWQLVREAEKRRPDAVVLVDFPGFNLRFAAQMKKARRSKSSTTSRRNSGHGTPAARSKSSATWT